MQRDLKAYRFLPAHLVYVCLVVSVEFVVVVLVVVADSEELVRISVGVWSVGRCSHEQLSWTGF